MAAARPTVRTQVDLPLPDLTPYVRAWTDMATTASADAFAEANRRWLAWWFDSATKAVDAWWSAALPRR